MRVNDYAVDLRKYIKNFDKIYAHIDGCRKETIIEHIDDNRTPDTNLSAAIRVWILKQYRQ